VVGRVVAGRAEATVPRTRETSCSWPRPWSEALLVFMFFSFLATLRHLRNLLELRAPPVKSVPVPP
jgi:hypothetical protein